MDREHISFKGAQDFKITGGNFGSVGKDVVTVNTKESPLDNRQRRLGSRTPGRRRPATSIPPPSPTSSQPSDSDSGPEAGVVPSLSPSSRRTPGSVRSTGRGTSRTDPHSPRHPATPAPTLVSSPQSRDFLSPLPNSLGLSGIQSPRLVRPATAHPPPYSPNDPPSTVAPAIPATSPAPSADTTPATLFARLQAESQQMPSRRDSHSPNVVVYTPSPAPAPAPMHFSAPRTSHRSMHRSITQDTASPTPHTLSATPSTPGWAARPRNPTPSQRREYPLPPFTTSSSPPTPRSSRMSSAAPQPHSPLPREPWTPPPTSVPYSDIRPITEFDEGMHRNQESFRAYPRVNHDAPLFQRAPIYVPYERGPVPPSYATQHQPLNYSASPGPAYHHRTCPRGCHYPAPPTPIPPAFHQPYPLPARNQWQGDAGVYGQPAGGPYYSGTGYAPGWTGERGPPEGDFWPHHSHG